MEENTDADKQTPPELPIEVPLEVLSVDLLTAVVENFILREGTDYGAVEVSLEAKVRQVLRQIEKGEVKIVFDTGTESVTLMTAREFQKSFKL